MNIKIDRSFEKDINKIQNKAILKKVVSCIENVKEAGAIVEIKDIKKIKRV